MLAPVQHPRLERQHRRHRADGLHPARPAARGGDRAGATSSRGRRAGRPSRQARGAVWIANCCSRSAARRLPASWLPGADRADRRGARGAAEGAAPRRRGAGRDLQHAAAPDRAHRAASPSARPISRNWSPGRRCRRPSSPTASRRRRPPASRARTASRSAALERVETPKGVYLAFRKQQRGKAAVDVLPDVLGAACCATSRSRSRCTGTRMLDDGRGELLFGRPIRWILFLYGGRVVPFTIGRAGGRAEPPRAGRARRAPSPTATASSRRAAAPGRAIKVRSVRRVPGAAARELRHPGARGAPRRRSRASSTRTRAASAGASAAPRRASRGCCRRCRTWSSTRRSSPARSRPSSSSCPRKC